MVLPWRSLDCRVRQLEQGWRWCTSEAGAVAHPAALPPGLDWRPARLPTTLAALLRDAGTDTPAAFAALAAKDLWFRCEIDLAGGEVLDIAGLAGIAELWCDDVHLLHSENDFRAHCVALPGTGRRMLSLCFRSLPAALRVRRGRAAWRARLAEPAGLRLLRHSQLGHMRGWCPEFPAIGPWRGIALVRPAGDLGGLAWRAGVAQDCPVLDITLPAGIGRAILHIGDAAHRLGGGSQGGRLQLPGLARWMPHTHGAPALHAAVLECDGITVPLGRIGFRALHAAPGADANGFQIFVNGTPIFCRGACWTTTDIISRAATRAAYAPWLAAARDAGMNMLRVGGTMAYESAEFFELCDELGILVWQDVMLANFAYPVDESWFRAEIMAELAQLAALAARHCSLAVICGGSEVMQQAAMLGLRRTVWEQEFYTDFLPDALRGLGCELPYVANSPSGGELPFRTDAGIAHYYGVGAYRRPLDDARRAGVRFAAECLALANVPAAGGPGCAEDRRGRCGVPEDPGAGWDFADVRDHYLALLHAIDAHELRFTDPARYLDLSRDVSCALIEAVFGEWRRAGSSCAGGLIWQLQDVQPGSGWGLLTVDGQPKPAWHAARRAFAPRALFLIDEGLNGLDAHVVNDTAEPLRATLHLRCLAAHGARVREAAREIAVPPRGTLRLSSAVLLDGFFDICAAYRFGPAPHQLSCAWLADADGAVIAQATHFLQRPLRPEAGGLNAALRQDGGRWLLELSASRFLYAVHLDIPGWRGADEWFHLPPDLVRSIKLVPLHADPPHEQGDPPRGHVAALNLLTPLHIGGTS